MKRSNWNGFFRGRKPPKMYYYLVTLLAWLYIPLSIALIIWLSEESDMSTFLEFIIVFVLMVFAPSIQELFKSYSSFIEEQHFEKTNEEE